MRHIRLKVRTRIYLGFAVLVVLSLGIAAFGVYQLSGVSTNVGKMDLLATSTQRVLTITRQLEAIRRAETRHRSLNALGMAGSSDPSRGEHTTRHTRSGALSCAVLLRTFCTVNSTASRLAARLPRGRGGEKDIDAHKGNLSLRCHPVHRETAATVIRCTYATPNRTARSLRNVSASLLNRSISDPTAAASAESDASRPSVRNSCLRCCSVSEETFPIRRSRWSSTMNCPAVFIRRP